MEESIFYEETNESISLQEAEYWKRMFQYNLKVGVEIEAEHMGNERRTTLRNHFSSLFEPSERFGRFGKSGVYKVVDDGSLRNGVEICTVGRRINFIDLYVQYKTITDAMINKEFKVDERCGLHSHMLFSYYEHDQNELEKPIPGIIMKNFFQLLRRYAPALVWITSSNFSRGNENVVTRYENFCRTKTLFGITPIGKNLENYIRTMHQSDSSRYQFCNTRLMGTSENQADRMHIELRFADGSLYPAQIVSQNVLYAAIFIKAIELSQIGVISTGSNEYWESTKSTYSRLRQGSGFTDNRCSDAITEEIKEMLIKRTHAMLNELKHSIYFYEPLAYRILKVLAHTPISIMRHTQTDTEINNAFNDLVKVYYENDTDNSETKEIIKAMQLQSFKGCVSKDQWIYKLCENKNGNYKSLQKSLKNLEKVKKIGFDTSLGVLYFK